MTSNNHIPYVNIGSQWEEDRTELLPIIDQVLESGQYVGGDHVETFEKNVAKYCNVKYAISLNSGTDALAMALHLSGVGRGDEVITPPNSFIASTAVIVHLGATPVFVDVLNDQNIDPSKIENAITKNTKAIMPVHLTGRMCEMEPILDIAEKYGLIVIEDAAQAIGSKYKNQISGSMGYAGCFSTHPLKNLNACGDGGFITTNEEKIYKSTKSLCNHGMHERDTVNHFGYVSRMDNLQAAILNYRLSKLDSIIEKRRDNATKYNDGISDDSVFIPNENNYQFNTYHTFVIQLEKRDLLQSCLKQNNIDTAIHYPIPIHLQPAAKYLGYKYGDFPVAEKQAENILTLPINQSLTNEEISSIIEIINQFLKENK